MANVFATRTGVWSATATWNTSALPATVDDVYSNNFTVYVDNSFQVRTVTNLSAVGITAGGFFVLNNAVTLSANVIGGGTNGVACVQFLSAAPATATLVGNLCAINTTISGPRALIHNGSGTMTVYGNGLGRIKGTGNPADGYIQNNSTGTLNLFGNYIPCANNFVDNRGIWNQTSGIINIVGNLSGGPIGTGECLYNNGTGVVNITGNIIATASSSVIANVGAGGIVNIIGNINASTSNAIANSSIINISGNIVGGSSTNSTGIANQATTSLLNITGNVIGGTGTNGFGISNSSFGWWSAYLSHSDTKVWCPNGWILNADGSIYTPEVCRCEEKWRKVSRW